MNDVCLVVPTIRMQCFRDFITRWDNEDLFEAVDLIVTEDNPRKTFDVISMFQDRNSLFPPASASPLHLCWQDIEDELGSDSWIIPRRSDCVRSYGYLKAWQLGYKFIMTLDDDCYPPTQADDGVEYRDGADFVQRHVSALTGRTRWYNTLNDVTPRGVPYFNRGKNWRVLVNHGLWTNALDYDAPRQLVAPEKERFSFDSQVVPSNSYFPMCGMNVMWKREATVLMYHLLMGMRMVTSDEQVGLGDDRLERFPFDRFGDIWCGIIMKKIVDDMGYNVSTGMPYVRHERASNPFTNLKKEAPGLEVNERFWEHVDCVRISRSSFMTERSLPIAYKAMAQHVGQFDDFPEHVEYFKTLGRAMEVWADMLTPKDMRVNP